MENQTIKVATAYESDTNPRGTEFEGKEFDELVASIKEKGVIVPVIVRLKGRTVEPEYYEIVAGNRRFRAAKIAQLEDIPARIMTLTDDEAKEVQIIENLQRSDIHPIEEGMSFRKLVEDSHYEVASIAAKVGKPEGYIRQRLFLTNLSAKPAAAYRAGKIVDGIAVLIAKLSAGDQVAALKEVTESYRPVSVKDLKVWIEEHIYSPISRQPWLGDEKMEKIVGLCVECKPASTSLFGEVKAGACTDLKCWKRKMDNYVNYRAKEEKLTKVSGEYSNPAKGILSKSEYDVIGKHAKDRCKSVHGAIVAQGATIGDTFDICSNKKCEVHHSRTNYEQSPKEREARLAEQKKEKDKSAKLEQQIVSGLKKIAWPVEEKTLDILIELLVKGNGTTVTRPICKRHGWKAEKTVRDNYSFFDYEKLIADKIKDLAPVEKMRLLTEFLIERTWGEEKVKIIKKLIS